MIAPKRKKTKAKAAPAKRKSRPARSKPKAARAPEEKSILVGAQPATIRVDVLNFQDIFNAPGVGVAARSTTIQLTLTSSGGGGKVTVGPNNDITVKGGKATIQFKFSGTYYPVGIAFSKDGDRSITAFQSGHNNFPNKGITLDNQTLTVTDEWVDLEPNGVFEFYLVIQQDTGDLGISDPIITNEA